MKVRQRRFRLAGLTLFLGLMATNVFAASLSYNPESTELTIEAGSSATIPMTVLLADGGRTSFLLFFVDSITGGNLPLSWIQGSPESSFISGRLPAGSTQLTLSVPAGTPAGSYSGNLMSMAMGAHGFADPGNGMKITINISSGCAKMPEFVITSFGPQVIWPPNHSMEVVTVTGRIVNQDGCTLSDIVYKIEDEYGIHSGEGEISLSSINGNFSLPVPVEASRRGSDMDGRHYQIILSASNDLGGTSTYLEVVVPHDMREKSPAR